MKQCFCPVNSSKATRSDMSTEQESVDHLGPSDLFLPLVYRDSLRPRMSGVDRYITRQGVSLNEEVKFSDILLQFHSVFGQNQLQSLSVRCSPHVWSLSLCGPTGSLKTLL